MAVKHIVTGGFGNGTLTTTVALVTLRGYVSGAAAVEFDDICIHDITANKPSVTSITANKPVAANIARVEC